MPDLQFPDMTKEAHELSKAFETFAQVVASAARSLWDFSGIYYQAMSSSEYQEMQRHARNKARYERHYKKHSRKEK